MNYVIKECETGFLKSKDETEIFYRFYRAKKQKAMIYLIHGFGEHSGRYYHLISRLNDEGFGVFCIDFRGHGHSMGKRGDIESFCDYENDFIAGIKYIEKNVIKDEKLFLIAHSMGALVSLLALSMYKHSASGMVLSSPLMGLKIAIPTWKRLLTHGASKIMPGFRLGTGIKGIQLSSDNMMAMAYDNDPLVLKSLTIRAFNEMVAGYQKMNARTRSPRLPFFLQIAGDDFIVDSDRSIQWFEQMGDERMDATLKVYPGFKHEIYNEAKREMAINDCVEWLNDQALFHAP